MEKSKKIFFYAGIPCLAFYVFIEFNYFVMFSVSFFLPIVAIGAATIRKDKIWTRLTKLSVLMVIIYFIFNINLILFPNQFLRHLPGGRNSLIEPDNPKIAELKEDFCDYHLWKYGVPFESLNNGTDFEKKMSRVDYFVHYNICEYTNDYEAPYYYWDHIPTVDEIFASDTDGDGRLQDDCDGISILTTSLLLHMGYNAYISECSYHWHTFAFPEGADPKTSEGWDQKVWLYNPTHRVSYFMFNQTDTFTAPDRPLWISILDNVLDERTYTKYYEDYFEGDYIDLSVSLLMILAYVAFFVLNIGLCAYLTIGMSTKIQKEAGKRDLIKVILKYSFYGSLIVSLGAVILYSFVELGIALIGNVFVWSLIGANIGVLDWLLIKKSDRNTTS